MFRLIAFTSLISSLMFVSSHPSLLPNTPTENELSGQLKTWKNRAKLLAHQQLAHWKPRADASHCSVGICEGFPNYPTEAVEILLDQSPGIAKMLRSASEGADDKRYDVTARSGSFEKRSMCDADDREYEPQYQRDTNNDMRVVVNLPGTYKQSVTTSVCRQSGGHCLYSDRLGLETVCEQKYMTQKLLVVSSDGRRLEMGEFDVPSACVCKIKLMRH